MQLRWIVPILFAAVAAAQDIKIASPVPKAGHLTWSDQASSDNTEYDITPMHWTSIETTGKLGNLTVIVHARFDNKRYECHMKHEPILDKEELYMCMSGWKETK